MFFNVDRLHECLNATQTLKVTTIWYSDHFVLNPHSLEETVYGEQIYWCMFVVKSGVQNPVKGRVFETCGVAALKKSNTGPGTIRALT